MTALQIYCFVVKVKKNCFKANHHLVKLSGMSRMTTFFTHCGKLRCFASLCRVKCWSSFENQQEKVQLTTAHYLCSLSD